MPLDSDLLVAGSDPAGDAGKAHGKLRGFLRQSMRSKLLRNIVTVVSGTAGAQAMTMAFMPVITRLYGPEAYGILGAFMSLTLMIVPIAALTYPIAIVLPRRDADARGLVKLSLTIALLLAASMALALWLFGTPIVRLAGLEEISPYLMLLPVVMFFGAALEVVQQWLIRQQRFSLTASIAIAHSLLHNSIRTLGGVLMAIPAVLVITTALGPALQAAMLAIGIRRTGSRAAAVVDPEPPMSSGELARRYSDFPLFRFPQMLINTVSQNLPTLVLASVFGPAAAGFFTVCKQALSMPTNLIGKSVADVYYPRISQAIQRHEPIAAMLAKATAGLALVGLLPFGLVFFSGPWLFALVFGEQWHTAGEFARWLALSEYVVLITRPCAVAIPALELQGRFLVFEICSTVLRLTALFVGAWVMKDALITVIAFAAASVLIYLALIVSVLIAARNHRPPTADH
jgi:O-antigen/teichoic acid export membrane protein